MIDIKRIDDKDFVFVKRALIPKEEKAFSDFLKLRKLKIRKTRAIKKAKDITKE